MRFSTFATGALAAALVSAHPGEKEHAKEMARLARREFLDTVERRDLSHCAAQLKERGIEARNIKRRAEKAAALRRKLGLPDLSRRQDSTLDIGTVLNTSHLSTANYTLDTSSEELFASEASCILQPESVVGPYYVAGEYIRSDVTEVQEGVPIHLELQILDVETCEPVDGLYLEIWAANSTGVYGGVSAQGNGNSATDLSNLNATFLRGVQLTDDVGVAAFDTLVPGHYTGRTNHIHLAVHPNATAQANGTLLDTTVSHVGQVFFDQDLLYDIEALSPYSENTQDYTINEEDGILAAEAEGSDPVVEYIILGDTLQQGLLGWLSFGINTSYIETISAASTFYESGGVANSNGGGQPEGPGGPGPF